MGENTGRNVQQPEWKNERDIAEDREHKEPPRQHPSKADERGSEPEEVPSPGTRRM